MAKQLYRSRKESLAGVCQGLADWSGISVGVIRLVFIIGFFAWGSTVVLYILLAIFLPKEPKAGSRDFEEGFHSRSRKEESFQEGFEDIKTGAKKFATSVKREVYHALNKEFSENPDNRSGEREERAYSSREESQEPTASQTIQEEVDRLKRKYGTTQPDNLSNEAHQKQKESEWDSKFHDSQ